MNRIRNVFLAAIGWGLVGGPSQDAGAASITPLLPRTGEGFSVATAISANGSRIVGRNESSASSGAFVWDRETGMREIFDERGQPAGGALAVTADGSTVLVGGTGGSFLWDEVRGARPIGLDFNPLLMSADGSTFVGRRSGTAVAWNEVDGIRELGSIPGGEGAIPFDVSEDGSTIVGWEITDRGQEGFVWTREGGIRALGDLPDGSDSGLLRFPRGALSVSADGSTIAGASQTALGREAVLWDAAGGMSALGDLDPIEDLGLFSIATDVSGDGSVVVGEGSSGTFLWDEENGMRDLEVVLTRLGIDLGGWRLGDLLQGDERPRISADGRTIVGIGYYHGQKTSYVAVIPEPSVAVLLGGGLAGLAFFAGSGSTPGTSAGQGTRRSVPRARTTPGSSQRIRPPSTGRTTPVT